MDGKKKDNEAEMLSRPEFLVIAFSLPVLLLLLAWVRGEEHFRERVRRDPTYVLHKPHRVVLQALGDHKFSTWAQPLSWLIGSMLIAAALVTVTDVMLQRDVWGDLIKFVDNNRHSALLSMFLATLAPQIARSVYEELWSVHDLPFCVGDVCEFPTLKYDGALALVHDIRPATRRVVLVVSSEPKPEPGWWQRVDSLAAQQTHELHILLSEAQKLPVIIRFKGPGHSQRAASPRMSSSSGFVTQPPQQSHLPQQPTPSPAAPAPATALSAGKAKRRQSRAGLR